MNKIDIIGFDYYKETVGSYWCKRNYKLPDILSHNFDEKYFLNFVINTILEEEIKILFIGVDFELLFFSKYKDFIFNSSGCLVIVSSEEVIKIADDKYATYQFLKHNELEAPISWLPIDMPKDIEFPLIVKPRKGARSVGVQKVENKSQLNKAITDTNDPIIQEYIGSDLAEYTCGIIFFDNKLRKSIALNRTLKAGNTFLSHFSFDINSLIYEYISKIAYKLKPFGSCNLQLRLDSNGIPKLFEINSRHSGTTYIRSLFGYNEIQYIIEYIINNKEIDFFLKEGTVVRYHDEFFVKNI